MKHDHLLRVLATICFFILLFLQYKLLSSSYEIEHKEFSKTEKKYIKEAYELAIINDKLYPSGQEVIDEYLSKDELFSLQKKLGNNPIALKDSLIALRDHVILELRAKSNMDSLLSAILELQQLDLEEYGYALTLDHVAVSFDGKKYIHLSQQDSLKPVLIDGDGHYISPNNVITSVSVSAYEPYSYLMKFTLYGLDLTQRRKVFKKIFPLLALTAVSVLMIAVTYLRTFRSWQKQKKLNEISQDFLNSITHEFKTPISSIAVSVKNLLRETQGLQNERIAQSIEVIDRQSKRIDQMVDQALWISMFNPDQLCFERRNLTEDLEKIVYDLRLKYVQNPNVYIDIETGTEEIFAEYDLFLLTTAVNNLIENGIKHNHIVEKEVTLRLLSSGRQIILEVLDNGEGIDHQERRHVFRKFYQGEKGKEKGGLGLGLYYVHEMIRIHAWQLELAYIDGEGMSVKIIIPTRR